MSQSPAVLLSTGYATIFALSGGDTELWIYGDIGANWYDEESLMAKDVAAALAAVTGGTLTVRINSYGGVVADAIGIYNAIRRCAAAVKRVEIDGVAMSSASMVAMAADPGELRIAANALLMIHAPWGIALGNAQYLREQADMLDRYAAAMATSYARGAITEAAALALLTDGADHYYTAAEAVAAGLADAVSTADLPALARAASPTIRAAADARYRHPPKTLPAPTAGAYSGDRPMADSKPVPADPKPAPVAAPEVSRETDEQIQVRAQQMIAAHHGALDQAFAPLLALPGYPHAELVREVVAQARADLAQTPDKVRAAILAKLGEQTMTPMGGASNVRVSAGADEADKRREAGVLWMLARANIRALRQADGTDRSVDLTNNPCRGQSLMDMARASLRAANINPDGLDKREVVARAFQGTGDFPILFENALNKVLLQGYRIQADTWSKWCKTGTANDFRAQNRYRVGSIGTFQGLTEAGEFRQLTIPDGEKGSVTVSTKGNIIAVTREAIINDDLGALTDLALSLGRAGKRTIEAAAYASLAENSGCGPLLSDGKAVFHADHANKEATTKGAPSISTLAANRVLLSSQKDVGGNDYLALTMAVWLGPLALGDAARVVNGSQYDPDTANKLQRLNVAFGSLRDIVDTPRLTGYPWYTLADPNEAPVFEVVFLDGQMEPYTETRNGWTTDGAEIKARLDFGVGAIDYRGAVRNDGN